MAASTTTTGVFISMSASTTEVIRTTANRRRPISPEAGHALEILGHAIEYLTDEFIHEGGQAGGPFSADNSQLQAVQLLMALNCQVYFECPEVPPFGQRLPSLFHRQVN